jgi:hypothetical protein
MADDIISRVSAIAASRTSADGSDVPPAGSEARSATRGDDLGDALNIQQVAALIGCSPWTVRNTLMPKGLPCFRAGANGRLIFYRHQVVRWLLRQQRLQGGHL